MYQTSEVLVLTPPAELRAVAGPLRPERAPDLGLRLLLRLVPVASAPVVDLAQHPVKVVLVPASFAGRSAPP